MNGEVPHNRTILNALRRYGFLAGVIAALAVAWLFPGPALDGGWLRSAFTTRVAVSLIFLLQGLVLPTEALARGVLKWREHVFIHGFLFGVFPLLALGVDFLFGTHLGWLGQDVRLGLLFLAILPTTISTCVVLTAEAGGNVATALFNATVSNVLAVFLVPLWILWAAGYRPGEGASLELIADIAMLIVLPLAAGQAIRPWLKTWAEGNARQFRTAANGAVLFIIYVAFARSVAGGYSGDSGGVPAAAACGLAAAYFFVIHLLVWRGSSLFRFSGKDRLAILFCAPQKSLATAVPMAQLIFVDRSDLSLILLPILLYHTLQLLFGGILVGRMRKHAGD